MLYYIYPVTVFFNVYMKHLLNMPYPFLPYFLLNNHQCSSHPNVEIIKGITN